MRRLTTPLVAVVALLAMAISAQSALAVAPAIPTTTFSVAKTETVILEADVNPEGKEATYRFEYGLAACSSSSCTTTANSSLPAGTTPVRVKVQVKGLTPNTLYHFRAIAKNGNTAADTTKGPDQTFTTQLLPQKFAPCPNDGIRKEAFNPSAFLIEYLSENLPDCRAYEQSSPVDKNGGDLTATVPFLAATNGKVTFLSSSGVPGGEGSQELPVYLASRGAGWSTQGLLPPADAGQNAEVIGWTPDLSWIFDRADKLGEPQKTSLYARSSSAGPLLTIVKDVTGLKPRLAGASTDGDVVVFESKVKLTGEAIEGRSNIYLWQRSGDKLSLLSVLNDGSSPAKGAFAGPYDWIKGTSPATLNEGGATREYYTQDLGAISPDGRAAFFTAAGTGQLYLRRNPTQAQSPLDGEGKCKDLALACTIRISTSQKTNGKGPDGTDPAGERPAAFMGASTDGTRSFFTSTEMLTDDANTGPEQEPAAIACANAADGSAKDLKCISASAAGIAVDATHIYWANPPEGTIGRAKLDGTEAIKDFIAEAGNPQYVAVDAGHVYWTNAGGEEKIGEGTIGRAKLDGTDIEPACISGASNPQGIAVNSTHIFWGNAGVDNAIARAEIDCTDVELVFHKIGNIELPQGVALNATHIYFASNNPNGFITRVDLDGTNEKFIFLGGAGTDVRGVAVDPGHVYWATEGKNAIGRASLDLSDPELEFIKEAGKARGLAQAGTQLYWSAGLSVPNPGNDLYLYDAKTGVLSDLAVDDAALEGTDVQGVLGVSEDGSQVYFAANGVPKGTTNSPNANGESATAGSCKGNLGTASGVCNLYLWDEGEVSFIARLDVGGAGFATDAANWAATPTGVFPGVDFQKTARVSAGGQTLLFRSQRQLSDYDNDGIAQIYHYRAGEAGLACVSCNPSGEGPKGTPSFGTIAPSAIIPKRPASVLAANLSEDGDLVFFESPDALVGADVNGDVECPTVGSGIQKFRGCQDVYVWQTEGSGTCTSERAVAGGGCLYLLSTGKALLFTGKSDPSFVGAASPSGIDTFLFSRSRLVGQDQDELVDVYDARVGGGLASQNQPPPPDCEGNDSCQGPPGTPPVIESPTTSTYKGTGNVKHRCPKGKKRVKGRCVKAKPQKAKKGKGKAHKGRRANHDRRTER